MHSCLVKHESGKSIDAPHNSNALLDAVVNASTGCFVRAVILVLPLMSLVYGESAHVGYGTSRSTS